MYTPGNWVVRGDGMGWGRGEGEGGEGCLGGE